MCRFAYTHSVHTSHSGSWVWGTSFDFPPVQAMCTATAALVLLACATSEAPHTRGADGVPSAGGARNHPSCLVVIERHNHKTGGTTMRDIFAHQQAAGRCFYWGYGPAPPYWDGLMQILENGGMPFAAPTGHSLKLCVELHFRVPYWADAVRARRAARRPRSFALAARAARC